MSDAQHRQRAWLYYTLPQPARGVVGSSLLQPIARQTSFLL